MKNLLIRFKKFPVKISRNILVEHLSEHITVVTMFKDNQNEITSICVLVKYTLYILIVIFTMKYIHDICITTKKRCSV